MDFALVRPLFFFILKKIIISFIAKTQQINGKLEKNQQPMQSKLNNKFRYIYDLKNRISMSLKNTNF